MTDTCINYQTIQAPARGSNVIDLMAALKRSIERPGESGSKGTAASSSAFWTVKPIAPSVASTRHSTGKVDIVDPFRTDNQAYYKYHAKKDKNGTKGTFSYETELYAGNLVALSRVPGAAQTHRGLLPIRIRSTA